VSPRPGLRIRRVVLLCAFDCDHGTGMYLLAAWETL
jgi:hypothetical protein